jgi:site-specific DNA-cytosine methylase
LRVLPAPTWHRMLCSGVSNHVMTQVLTFIRSNPASPLCGLTSWRIVTAFSGPESFLACVRSLSPPLPYTLLASSDTDPACRAVIRAVHSRLQSKTPAIFESAQSTGACRAPFCDLTCWGYPCVLFSDLNRFATDDDIAGSISLFDAAFGYLLLRRPPVFIFEDVASLLSTRLVWVVDHFLFKINSLGGYRIYLSILCPSYFDATMTRPRLIVVAMRLPGMLLLSLSSSFFPFLLSGLVSLSLLSLCHILFFLSCSVL